ncbi:MAG: sigma-70 family RNA polymerase sigma factor [Planctomycetia bacterium]|jgi:RNA polymerase sigma-70 factor (ECF subfamily)
MGWNREKLGELVDRHGAALGYYARQLGPSWAGSECDDLLQDALISLLRKSPPPDDPLAWLYGTLRRLALFRARTEGRRVRHENCKAQARANELPPWHVEDLARREQIERLMQKLETLDDELREIVVMHLWGKLTFKQIGPIVGCSSSKAHREYQRALCLLQEAIES